MRALMTMKTMRPRRMVRETEGKVEDRVEDSEV